MTTFLIIIIGTIALPALALFVLTLRFVFGTEIRDGEIHECVGCRGGELGECLSCRYNPEYWEKNRYKGPNSRERKKLAKEQKET